jgi:hypothetical protein
VEVADIFRVVVCNTIGGVVRYPALDCWQYMTDIHVSSTPI